MGSTRDEAVQLFNDANLSADANEKVAKVAAGCDDRQSTEEYCMHPAGR